MNCFQYKTDALSPCEAVRGETRLLSLLGNASISVSERAVVSAVQLLDFWGKYPEYHARIKEMLGEGCLLLDMKATPKPAQWSSLQSRLFHRQYNLWLQEKMTERLSEALPPALFKLPVCDCREDAASGDSFSVNMPLKLLHSRVERLLEYCLLPLISCCPDPTRYKKLMHRFRVELLACQQVDVLSGTDNEKQRRATINQLQQLHQCIVASIDELFLNFTSRDTEKQEPMLFNPLPISRKVWLNVPEHLIAHLGLVSGYVQKHTNSAGADYLVGPVQVPGLSLIPQKDLLENSLLPAHQPVNCGHYFLENEWVRITVEANGSLTLLDKRSGEIYPRLNIFADAADNGTSSAFKAEPKRVEYLSKSVPVRRSLVAAGPLEGQIRIRYRMKIPAYSIPEDAPGAVMSIWCTVLLRADSPAVLFETKIDNTAIQHRLQVRFETGTNANLTEVGDWPDFTQAAIPAIKPGTRRCDVPAAKASLVNWLTVKDTSLPRGLTLFTRGIHGWQLVPDTYRTLALTLFRAIGEKANRVDEELPGGAACPGPMTFKYALLPLTENTAENQVAQQQLYYNEFIPTIDFCGGSQQTGLQPPVQISVPDTLLLDMWKMAEDGNGYIMRVVNWQDQPTTAKIVIHSEVKRVFVTDLYEVNKRELQLEAGAFELTVPKRSLRTLRIISK